MWAVARNYMRREIDSCLEDMEEHITSVSAAQLVGTREERRYHLACIQKYIQSMEGMDKISSAKKRQKAYQAKSHELRAYQMTTFLKFVEARTFKDVAFDSPLFQELTESSGPESEITIVRPWEPRVTISSSVNFSRAPDFGADWRSVMSRGDDDDDDEEEDLPELGGDEPNHIARRAMVASQGADKVWQSALFRLINVDDPRHKVAVQEEVRDARGGFGIIYKGHYIYQEYASSAVELGRIVAAKRNLRSGRSMSEDERIRERRLLRKRMLQEARIAEYLDRPTIAHYFGLFANEFDLTNELADLYLVSDYVNGGLARDFLRVPENRTRALTEKLFHDLVDGLTYMHSEQRIGNFDKKMICHGDLKGNNYLVEIEPDDLHPGKSKITGKIIDFGLSYRLGPNDEEQGDEDSQVTDAYRWRAPEMTAEVVRNEAIRNSCMEKADVWSFALTSLEINEDRDPFSQLDDEAFYEMWTTKPEELVELLPKRKDGLKLSDTAFAIMLLCWNLRPAKRPHMHEVQELYLSKKPSGTS